MKYKNNNNNSNNKKKYIKIKSCLKLVIFNRKIDTEEERERKEKNAKE